MCSYCGCRAIGPIADLTAEHVQIQNLCGQIRRDVAAGNLAEATARLPRLEGLLHRHDTVEELSIYAAMARLPEYSHKVGTLFDEHDAVDAAMQTALATARSAGAGAVDWGPLLAAFDTLVEHIQHEENGLFPAAAIALDTQDWDHAQRIRDRDNAPT